MRRTIITVAASALLCATGPATAQEGPVGLAVLDALEGEWVGEGTLLGRDAAFTMEWTRLESGDYQLDFTNAFVAEDGSRTRVLGATAIYSVAADGSITGDWSDTRPQQIEITAVASDSTLTSEWTAPAETGRTEYVVTGPSTAIVRDWVRVDGALRPFGEARYTKRPPQ